MSKLKAIYVYMLVSLFLSAAQAQIQCQKESEPDSNKQELSISSGNIDCIGRSCYYIPQESSIDDLRGAVKRAVFGSDSYFFMPEEGFINEGRDSREIAFWHKCQEKLEEMKKYMILADQPIGPTEKERIKFNIKIYHITNSHFNELALGLGGIFRGIVESGTPRGSITSKESGGSLLNYAFGNLTTTSLTANLSFGIKRNTAYKVEEFSFSKPVASYFNTSNMANSFRDNGFGNSNSEEVGYRAHGVFYVNNAGGEKQILLKDFHVTYSVPQSDPNVIAKVLRHNDDEIVLTKNKPYVFYTENIQFNSRSKDRGLPYLGNSNIRTDSKLVIFVSAYSESDPPLRQGSPEVLTNEEISRMPVQSRMDVLSDVDFTLQRLGADEIGFDLITMNLNKEALSQEMLDQFIYLSISVPGLPKIKNRRYKVQDLVYRGFQLPSTVSYSNGRQKEIELKLEWASKDFGKSQKSRSVEYVLLHDLEVGSIDVLEEKPRR